MTRRGDDMNTSEQIRSWELQLKKHERRLEQADTDSSEYMVVRREIADIQAHLRRLDQHYQR